jgi:hypothetical protein
MRWRISEPTLRSDREASPRVCATATTKSDSGRDRYRRDAIELEVFRQKVGASYAAAVQALLEDGPLQGTTVEVEAVEGRPPKTVDVPDDKGSVCRYCLAEWTQEGMTAAYTFLYAV